MTYLQLNNYRCVNLFVMKIKNIIVNSGPAQAVLIFILTVVAIIMFSAGEQNSTYCWLFASSGVLFFAIGNPLLGIFNKKWLRYTGLSLATHLLLTYALYNLAQYSCDISGDATIHHKKALISLFIFYFLAVGLTALFRLIIISLESTSN